MNKFEGIKEGDTVEVTFRGVVRSVGGFPRLTIKSSGSNDLLELTDDDVFDRHFSIKKVEKPLAVGDRVSIRGELPGTILAMHGSVAWVHHDAGSHETWRIDALERVS